jgi:threonylcarbamoyladenosine tRNA methylthiotransferase CDKAL1
MKAYVEAYGCTLNFGESREIEDHLSSRGWDIVHDAEESDLTVLATCVVIETTERAMLKRIKELSGRKHLIITGCMATACREKAEKIAPEALFLAPGDIPSLSMILDGFPESSARPAVIRESFGIVPIATGCRGTCSYCITRLARGDLNSRLPDRIVEAVLKEVSNGPKEIQLTAQDTAAYGTDMGTDLPSLVSQVCSIPFDFRVRVGMMNPRSALPIKGRIADMYLQKKVFKFLHLPIQSGSHAILEHMERGYSVFDFMSIVNTVRAKVPRVTISTDIIVGYPGESEDDHKRNLSIVSDLQPDIVNVTRFSSRPGTKASLAENPVVGWKAKDRSREITELKFEVSEKKNREWIGEQTAALATEKGKRRSTVFRNDEYKQIVVQEVVPLGSISVVEIFDATPTYLLGKRIGH